MISLFSLTACSNGKLDFKVNKLKRDVASENSIEETYLQELKTKAQEKNHILEFPSGVKKSEQLKMWHLTEGSDIYPTLWLLNLKSFLSNDKGSLFFKDLDKKFGLIKSPYYNDQFSPYSWVGLTAVWDGEDQKNQDLILENIFNMNEVPKIKKLKSGKPSVLMTGANCAFCHTGVMNSGEKGLAPIIIDGAPATIDMKGFFYDIIGSTYQMMFDEKELVAFYQRMEVDKAEEKALRLVSSLKKELNVEDTVLSEAIKLLIKAPVIGKKINASVTIKAGKLLYEKKEVLTKYLIRMLQETYDLNEVTLIMKKRMEYLTWFGALNPDVITTSEGYGRTDAFGRISNATIRKRSYTHLTAPVSLPPMYAMKYKAFYHYNANTNSLVARNIGQSFGLGAIALRELPGTEKIESTTNIPNLIELEKLINKVPVPEYTKFFPLKMIDKKLIVKGCNVYLNKCIQCHEANDQRVGPAKVLIDHKLTELSIIDTDRQYIKNISKDALGMDFKKAIFNFTDQVKAGYYTEYNVSIDEQKRNAQEDLRGKEIFRDTYMGESRFESNSDLSYANIKPGHAYVARHLAGIWSTAPYLHNGSVPNLYELLLPANKRSKKIVVGYLDYDHKKLGFESQEVLHKCVDKMDPYCLDTSEIGNSNRGHSPAMYGGELKEQDKLALIEFLKVLTPELEYSWSTRSIYKIENNNCSLR